MYHKIALVKLSFTVFLGAKKGKTITFSLFYFLATAVAYFSMQIQLLSTIFTLRINYVTNERKIKKSIPFRKSV